MSPQAKACELNDSRAGLRTRFPITPVSDRNHRVFIPARTSWWCRAMRKKNHRTSKAPAAKQEIPTSSPAMNFHKRMSSSLPVAFVFVKCLGGTSKSGGIAISVPREKDGRKNRGGRHDAKRGRSERATGRTSQGPSVSGRAEERMKGSFSLRKGLCGMQPMMVICRP